MKYFVKPYYTVEITDSDVIITSSSVYRNRLKEQLE